MSRLWDVTSSHLASGARFATGMRLDRVLHRPERPLVLYEFEACPFCRKVREMLTRLDLDVMVYPCPKGGTRFRPEVVARGGKAMFPYLIDPNTKTEMYESDAIVAYLARTYGEGKVPTALGLGPLTLVSSMLASGFRAGHGGKARPSKTPAEPLELWSMEISPYCRLVREALCELEIPYLLHNVAPPSEKRKALKERAGKTMVPYLEDPNTGRKMHESADIVRYLRETYGTG